MAGLHEYVAKDGTYLIKIKVTTDDHRLRSDIVETFFRPMMSRGEEEFMPGCEVESFYKHNFDEVELMNDIREDFVKKTSDNLVEALKKIKLTPINSEESRIEQRMLEISRFMDYCKDEGIDLPDNIFEQYFGA